MYLAAIGVGGFLGAISRYLVFLTCSRLWPNFPFGTMLVNIMGCFAAGLLFMFFEGRAEIWKPLLSIGFLGAFTTFSAFSVEVILMLESEDYVRASIHWMVGSFLCVGAAGAGLACYRLTSG